ncbi:MAG: sulfurtransferase TusA family protein [Desulfurivibrionaceae bacterium]|nr:sulfurtransferase TusA family protein [Desulfobulbales bacterium]MDT8334582.1 sulfurtransferase TusA family protein [Desulfurivibrionaceae bacterium]
MTNETRKTIEVDMRGQVCPSTLLVALDNINRNQKELSSGAVKLLIRTDNRNATTTIPHTAANMGYNTEVVSRDGYYELLISHLE